MVQEIGSIIDEDSEFILNFHYRIKIFFQTGY